MTRLHWSLLARSIVSYLSIALLVAVGFVLIKPFLLDRGYGVTDREKLTILVLVVLVQLALCNLSIFRNQVMGEEQILLTVAESVTNYSRAYFFLTCWRSVAAVVTGAFLLLFGMTQFSLSSTTIIEADLYSVGFWLTIVFLFTSLQNKIKSSDADYRLGNFSVLVSFAHLVAGVIIFKAFFAIPLMGFVVLGLYLVANMYYGRSVVFRYYPVNIRRNLAASLAGLVFAMGIGFLLFLSTSQVNSFLIWGMK